MSVGADRATMRVGGVAGWMIDFLRKRSGLAGARAEKQMRVLETLSLGPKRQLTLVSCAGKKFLVGTGMDGVQTIVSVDETER